MLDPKSKWCLEIMTVQEGVLRGRLVRRMIFASMEDMEQDGPWG